MQLGASLPVGDVGTGPAVVRDYAQTLEGLGFDYIQAPDHVLGGNPQGHKDRPSKGTTAVAYHDPFVLFSFIAGCTERIGFSPGVLILAQRQAVLVAKQAASLDELSGGRLRLGVGVGWNELEFTGVAGREPNDVGIEVWVSIGDANPDQWREEVTFWKQAGVTHITAHTTYDTGHHQRIAGRTAAEHLGAIKHFQDAVQDLL